MGHLKYTAYERGKSGNCRLEGHSTLFGINISLNCARDNFLFNGDAHFSLVSVSKFHGPRVKVHHSETNGFVFQSVHLWSVLAQLHSWSHQPLPHEETC